MSLAVRWSIADPDIERTLRRLGDARGWLSLEENDLTTPHLLVCDRQPQDEEPGSCRGVIWLCAGPLPAAYAAHSVLAMPAPLARIAEAIEGWQKHHSAGEPRALGGGVGFDPASRRLSGNGAEQELTDKEARLLEAVLAAGEDGIARDALLGEVWNYGPGIETHTLETHVYRLRQKLEAVGAPAALQIDQGRYRLASFAEA